MASLGLRIRATFWCSQMYEGLRARLWKPRVTPKMEKADGGHISVKLGDTLIETTTGKVLKEEGRLEVLLVSHGCPVPTFISAMPFVCCLIVDPCSAQNCCSAFAEWCSACCTWGNRRLRALVRNLKVA